jgi:hypothetical protein
MSIYYPHTLLEDLEEFDIVEEHAQNPTMFSELLVKVQSKLRCKLYRGQDAEGITGELRKAHIGYTNSPVDAARVYVLDGDWYVVAPSISNGKYHTDSLRHVTKKTTRPDVFLRNVSSHATPNTMGQEAAILWRYRHEGPVGDPYPASPPTAQAWFVDEHRRHFRAVDEMRISSSGHEKLFGRDLQDELINLHRAGHTFITNDLGSYVEELVEVTTARDEYLRNAPKHVMYVNTTSGTGTTSNGSFSVCISSNPDGSAPVTAGYAQYNTLTWIPYSVPLTDGEMSRIAALSICEQGQGVVDVGRRVSTNAFVIYSDHA